MKIGMVSKWMNKTFASSLMLNSLRVLKSACLNFVFEIHNDQSELNNSTAESLSSDCFYYGISEERNNKSIEGRRFKFENDLDKEIAIFSEFFVSRDTLKFISDTNEFWLQHKINLPILYKFAVKILSTPGTSAYIERFFSVSGIVCTNNSFNMNDDLIFMRSMLKANFRVVSELHQSIISDLIKK